MFCRLLYMVFSFPIYGGKFICLFFNTYIINTNKCYNILNAIICVKRQGLDIAV